MDLKLDFVVYYQGESEYRIRGGDHHGRIIRVLFARPDFYLRMAGLLRTPLERNMMEAAAALAGTVSFIGGEKLPPEVVAAARSRHRNHAVLHATIVAPDLKPAMLGADGKWVIYEPEPVPAPLHPAFVAARAAASARRLATTICQ
ncbi:hypothetical protein [Ottowia sp.]|uniref:hypothetical protein n=1 Tax=Ottowia sp. TaxID=1898956 RepID=UPI0025D471F8|nr:hypothetical protein [Ottowia sp.]MBK6616686.1 hypothetical protein [Ottowia sp.]